MRVLAIDPGERVGWAHGEIVTPEHTVGLEPKLEVTGQGVSALKDFALKYIDVVADYDVVIYETWRLYPHMAKKLIGNDMQPSQLVGIIRLGAWLHPQVRLVSQGASIKNTALKTAPDWLQERFKLSTEQHDVDALYHLWFYYWDHYIN